MQGSWWGEVGNGGHCLSLRLSRPALPAAKPAPSEEGACQPVLCPSSWGALRVVSRELAGTREAFYHGRFTILSQRQKNVVNPGTRHPASAVVTLHPLVRS